MASRHALLARFELKPRFMRRGGTSPLSLNKNLVFFHRIYMDVFAYLDQDRHEVQDQPE